MPLKSKLKTVPVQTYEDELGDRFDSKDMQEFAEKHSPWSSGDPPKSLDRRLWCTNQ